MIGVTILIEIIIFGLMMFMFRIGDAYNNIFACIISVIAVILLISLFFDPIAIGINNGYINYKESNNKDKARITAVTQEQNLLKTYYKVEVEYLTNTPTQDGMITNKNIEKDTFYCYYDNKELVEKLKNNMYKELWIISGYKGGYETYKDFGTKLIKDIELLEE